MALKSNKSQGSILSKGALMYSDFNYRPFNKKLLVEHEEESLADKDKDAEDSESKSEAGSNKDENANKGVLRRDSTRMSLSKETINEIMAAQQQDELADLVPLKICVQSDNYGTNVPFALS